jgi:predicted ATPase
LQSALGDIFVESENREEKGRHFIETHSDYLLLRCLRRIRETTNGRLSNDSNLRIQPTDVSILYFEPQSDGSTRIKPIRVSSQGDFLDRWPRGFFEERGKDLFDE